MTKEHAGGRAVVTGASSGLGAVFAEQLAERGIRRIARAEIVRRNLHAERSDGFETAVVDTATVDEPGLGQLDGHPRRVDTMRLQSARDVVDDAGRVELAR